MCMSSPKMPEAKVTAAPTRASARSNDPTLELADARSDADAIRKKTRGKRGLRIGRNKQTAQVGTGGLTNQSISIPTK